MEIKRYNIDCKQEWDAFIRSSRNGTFLLCRDFMDYHAHRFHDHSYLFYADGELIALLPGNESDGVYYSHQGLTYGGLVVSEKTSAIQVLAAFDLLLDTLRYQGFAKLVYKAIPHIYHRQPAEEDLYALFRNNAVLTERYISSAISLPSGSVYSRTRRNGLKKADKNSLVVAESHDFDSFWEILNSNLDAKYSTEPVHSVAEIQYLKERFPNEIKLYIASDLEGNVLAGTVAFITNTLVHLQYTAGTEEGKRSGAIDILVDYIIREICSDKKYFDYGHSNEDKGRSLNENLIYQKEGFGARGVVYDIYTIDLL